MIENWIESFCSASDEQLENILLCKILVAKKIFPDILPEYFTGKREQFYRAIESQWVRNKCIDTVLLKSDFYDNFTAALAESGSSSPELLERLHTLWQKRMIGKMIVESGEIQNTSDILAKFQTETGKISLKRSGKEYNHPEAIQRLLTILERAQKNDSKIAGFSTGLYEMDKFTSGIEQGKTYFFGALKKTGKSRFAIYLARTLRDQGAGIIYNSLEMNETQLNSCALAGYSGIDSNLFGRRIINDEYKKMTLGLTALQDLDWTICRERTIKNLRARIIDTQNKKPIHICFVDYIQRMQDETKESRTKEVEAIAIGLADISRDLNIAMIPLTQLTGAAENLGDEEMPNMSHMKESQAIAESGDCLFTLHNFDRRKNPFTEEGAYKLQEIYCLIEQRYDVSGVCFKFLADLRNCQFKNHTNPYEPRIKE